MNSWLSWYVNYVHNVNTMSEILFTINKQALSYHDWQIVSLSFSPLSVGSQWTAPYPYYSTKEVLLFIYLEWCRGLKSIIVPDKETEVWARMLTFLLHKKRCVSWRDLESLLQLQCVMKPHCNWYDWPSFVLKERKSSQPDFGVPNEPLIIAWTHYTPTYRITRDNWQRTFIWHSVRAQPPLEDKEKLRECLFYKLTNGILAPAWTSVSLTPGLRRYQLNAQRRKKRTGVQLTFQALALCHSKKIIKANPIYCNFLCLVFQIIFMICEIHVTGNRKKN